MFCIPGTILLIAFVYLRPQEGFPALQAVPMLNILLALSFAGVILDVRLGYLRLRATPHVLFAVGFMTWCAVTLAVKAPEDLDSSLRQLLVSASLFTLLACGISTFRALQGVVAVLLALVLFVAYVGVDQGFHEPTCHAVDWKVQKDSGISDGRPCETRRACERGEGAVPGMDYLCEKPGLFGTHSIGNGRVRYRGMLEDPNELTLASCAAIPFAFAFFERKKNGARMLLLLTTLVLVGLCTVFGQSRGGQLVFLTATGVYFVRRFGWKGILVGALLAAPMLFFGGRDGEEAESSSDERTMCLYVGMQLFRASPLFGVGQGQFTEHHILTAHNSYVLVAAETGLPGMILWMSLLYVSMKIPLAALRGSGRGELMLSPVAKAWALSLAASLAGVYVGIFFLSFSYHNVLWISLGLSGTFYAAVRRHEPRFDVAVSWSELGAVTLASCALIAAITVYSGWAVSRM